MSSELERKITELIKKALEICPMSSEELFEYVKLNISNGEIHDELIIRIMEDMERDYILRRNPKNNLEINKPSR